MPKVVLPEPRLPASRQVGGREVCEASARSKQTGVREPVRVWPIYGPAREPTWLTAWGTIAPTWSGKRCSRYSGSGNSAAGKRREEEAVLLAGGAVQLHPAVGLAQPFDPLLEQALLGCGEREDERGAQERRAVAAAEDTLELARECRSLGALDRGAVVARFFLAGDLVGVDLAAGEQPPRLAVGQMGDRERRVDREAELERGEHQLRRGAGHGGLLGHRAEDEVGLVAAPALGVDGERAQADGDPALVEAHQVVGVGAEALLAAGVEEGERLRGEALVDVGLAEAAGVGAADQAGDPARADPAGVEVAEHPLVDDLLGGAHAFQGGAADPGAVLEAETVGECVPAGGEVAGRGRRAGRPLVPRAAPRDRSRYGSRPDSRAPTRCSARWRAKASAWPWLGSRVESAARS